MLDSIKQYEEYDHEEISFGIERLPEQFHVAWNETRRIVVPARYKAAEEIVIVGMGAAGIVGELVRSALAFESRAQISVVSDYKMPAFVSQKTFVIAVSFSGATEEVLEAVKDAKKRRAKVAVVAGGGALGTYATKEGLLQYRFKAKRLATRSGLAQGYFLGGILGILERAEYIKLSDARVARILGAMSDVIDSCDISVKAKENPAKIVAEEMKGKSLLFVASEHLFGNARLAMHQANETSKQYARAIDLPGLNHHFMEGLSRPVGFGAKMAVLMIKSAHYHPRTQQRYEMTASAFEGLDIDVIDYEARGKDRIEEVAELLQFGSLLTYYLGILNKVNVATVAYTEHFKKEMGKR